MTDDASLRGPPLLVRTRPAVIQLSVYVPWVIANDYDSIRQEVTAPIKELLCENNFFLISSRVNGENLCPSSTTTTTTEGDGGNFDMDDMYFGNPDYSVLMETPAVVQENALGTVRWMSWTVAFYVAQLGRPLIEMAAQSENNNNNNNIDNINGINSSQPISDAKVSEVMNDVLKLALQVSILEGDMDERMSKLLPGARVSQVGEEVSTWAEYGIFSAQDVALYNTNHNHGSGGGDGIMSSPSGRNPPQHQLMNPPPPPAQLPRPSRTGPSIVAASMYESHGLRHTGIGMFATMLGIWLLLLYVGTRRKRIRLETSESQERKDRRRNVQLATEDDVSEMLHVGRQALRHNNNGGGGGITRQQHFDDDDDELFPSEMAFSY